MQKPFQKRAELENLSDKNRALERTYNCFE